jgi:hypothetical protein
LRVAVDHPQGIRALVEGDDPSCSRVVDLVDILGFGLVVPRASGTTREEATAQHPYLRMPGRVVGRFDGCIEGSVRSHGDVQVVVGHPAGKGVGGGNLVG